ncbi:MAG: cell division protein FtsQ/DivIB [Rickettsiales bacterium]|jgi:cell division septal protein FtsQ|nr:cell division protein FtsQ/DivIB [Rickettsiales bacterium]
MKGKLPLFVCAFAAGAIMVYAAVRFAIGDVPPNKIIVYSNIGKIGDDVRQFLSKNAKTPGKIPAELAERFPNIEHISVRNNQNGTADVRIKYKKVVGVWENDGVFYPLLENGAHISAAFPKKPEQGIVFRGALPNGVGEIIRILSGAPELAKRIRYLEYAEGRRWNIVLAGGALVMLPERNEADAIRRITGSGILGKSFSTLDLRDAGRALVK